MAYMVNIGEERRKKKDEGVAPGTASSLYMVDLPKTNRVPQRSAQTEPSALQQYWAAGRTQPGSRYAFPDPEEERLYQDYRRWADLDVDEAKAELQSRQTELAEARRAAAPTSSRQWERMGGAQETERTRALQGEIDSLQRDLAGRQALDDYQASEEQRERLRDFDVEGAKARAGYLEDILDTASSPLKRNWALRSAGGNRADMQRRLTDALENEESYRAELQQLRADIGAAEGIQYEQQGRQELESLDEDTYKAIDTLAREKRRMGQDEQGHRLRQAEAKTEGEAPADTGEIFRGLMDAGMERADIERLVDHRVRQIDRDTYEAMVERTAQAAQEWPVLSSLGSVAANVFSGAGYPEALAGSIAHPERPINYYAPGMLASGAVNTIRGQVAQDIGSEAGSFLYQTGMSMADSAVNMLLTAAGIPQQVGLAIMATGAASNALRDAHERGLSDDEALGMGLVSGAAEYFTERIGLDAFMETVLGGGRGGKAALRELLRNTLAEGGEEVASDVINLIADELIAGDRSQLRQNVERYREMGHEAGEAVGLAVKDQLKETGLSFLGGALSGGVMGATGVGINRLQENAYYKGAYGADSGALVEEALELNPESRTALEARERLQQGKQLSGGMLRQLVEQNEAQIRRGAGAAEETDEGAVAPEELPTAEERAQDPGPREPAQERKGEAGRRIYEAVRQMAPAGMSEAEIRGYFEVGYEIGRETAAQPEEQGLALAQRSLEGSGFTPEMVGSAYYAGREDLRYEEQKGDRNNGTAAEESVRVRGDEERSDGADPGGAGSRVAEDAGAAGERAGDAGGPADRGAAGLRLASEARSSAQLIGATRGSGTDRLRLVTGGDSAAVQKARAQAKARGLTAYFVTGDYMHVDGAKCRGYIRGNSVYIRADDPRYTADQIMRHESGHDAVAKGEIDPAEVLDQLERRYGEGSLDAIMDWYARQYADSGMSADEIWEELLCDSLGDMNVFAEDLSAVAPELDRVLKGVKDAALEHAMERQRANRTDTVKISDRNGTETGHEKTAPEGGRMSRVGEDKYYKRKIDAWDGKDHGGAFRVGAISDPLREIGIPDADIWFDESKAAKQLAGKAEINKEILKAIPAVIANPIAISESYDNTVLIFGQLFDEEGRPIVIALRVSSTNRRNRITAVNKIRSIGVRTHNLDKLLSDDSILYLSKNRKETKAWFNALGRSTPFGGTKFGFIRSISFESGKNNPQNPNGKTSRVVEPDAGWKAEQLRIIQENNPMEDSYHTGIRSVEDIKTFREAIEDPDWDYDEYDPDYTRGMAENALKAGKIRVYSSYAIEKGTFVSPSRMEVESYSGDGTVYSRTVRLEDVAWIDPTQGQYTGPASRSAADRVTKGRSYSYAELTAKRPIQGSVVSFNDVYKLFNTDGTVDIDWLVKHVLAQCQTVQTNSTTPTHYVAVADLGRNVEVTSNGITHGISRKNTIEPKTGRLPNTTEENAIGAINLAETLANAVEVNQLKGRGGLDTPYSHVLVGVTGAESAQGKTDYMAVRFVVEERENQDPILVEASVLSKLYSIDAKKMRAVNVQGAPRSVALAHTMPHFSYRIADLLNDVKDVFRDTFSRDVYAHFGMTREITDFSEGKKITLPDGTKQRPGNLKFSRVVDAAETLQEENEALRKQVKEFERALKATEKKLAGVRESRDNWKNKATFHPEKVGREILKAYESTAAESEIHDEVKALVEYAARRDGVNYEELRRLAAPAAAKVIRSASAVVNGEEAQVWADLKQHLRSGKIRVSQAAMNDMESWGNFWRKNGLRLGLTVGSGGVTIDTAYDELREKFGAAYFPESITHPADQLRRVAEVYDNLKPVFENPYSLNIAMAAEHCANDLVDMVMEEVARGYKATYVGQLQEQVYQSRQYTARLLQREREHSAEQIQALKDHYVAENNARREAREDSELRQRLLKVSRRLKNKKLPTVSRDLLNQYAREVLSDAEREIFAQLDTESVGMRRSTRTELEMLRDRYENLKDNDPNFIPDPATEERIKRLSRRQIDSLTHQEVVELTYALLNIENEIRNEKKLIDSRERRELGEAGVAVMRDIQNAPGSKASGVAATLDRLFVTETLSPLRQVRRMVGYALDDPLLVATNELADGQRKSFDYEMRAQARFRAFVEDKAFMARITGRKAEEITIRGIGEDGPTEAQITPAMKISLYLHSRNNQSLTHIAGGGIKVPDMKLYKRGKIQEAYARGTLLKLEPAEVKKVAASLTAEEKRFADAVYDYYNTMSKTEVNAVSEKLLGYPVAEVENYFPINTDDSFTRKDFESIKYDGSIEGMGFLKERIKSAAPVYLRDVNAVLDQSIRQHSRYVGLGVPVRNFNKLWGVTRANVTDDGGPGASSSVQSLVRKQWGETGRQYIEKMMSDLQSSGRTPGEWDKAMSRIRSSYARAVLTLNASVAMKQAASYPTAAAVVGWGPLAKAMGRVGKVDLDLIAAYTPLQWYRSKGFSTQELGDLAKRGIKLPPALNWVQGADLLTTRKLWKAAEIYVAKEQPGLQKGAQQQIREGKSPYYRAVAQVYDRIIEETQPNYTTMQRPQLLRSDSTLLQNLQMFKTQPFQNFNILYDAIGEMQARKRAYVNEPTAEHRTALREAKKRTAWAVTSQAVQLLVFAGMTLVWNAFRGKKDKYEDAEGDMTLLSTMKGVGLDMVGGLFSEIPFGGDVWELGSSVVTGGRYYGIDDVTASALSDAGTAVVKAGKILTELTGSVIKGETVNFNVLRLKLDSVADTMTKVIGVPYENVLNMGKAVFRNMEHWTQGSVLGEYAYLQLTTAPELEKTPYYDLLYEAYRKDDADYAELYRLLIESGDFDTEGIKSNMEKRMKKEQGVGSVKELEERWQAP